METKTTVTQGVPVRAGKKRRNQLPAAIVVLLGIIIVAVILGGKSPGLAISWVIGIGFGVVLQKSRFCFAAAFRDPFLTGSTSLAKAVIIAVAIASLGFGAVQYAAVSGGGNPPGFISPVGLHTAIGAILFGIGMVIAGGCASGTLMRVGEGFTMQWLVLVFFVIGTLWGTHDYAFWKAVFFDRAPQVHLPSALGWPLSFILQFLVLGALYILADKWGNRQRN
ncbi:MAG: YeeE/YedE family protein [Firmicutes bacterium]|nr:YeeE/YedE family protein [Bacillota bacterium]